MDETPMTRQARTNFTPEQRRTLEAAFVKTQYPMYPIILDLMRKTQLSEYVIKVWFKNRRVKWRRDGHKQLGLSGSLPKIDTLARDKENPPPISSPHYHSSSSGNVSASGNQQPGVHLAYEGNLLLNSQHPNIQVVPCGYDAFSWVNTRQYLEALGAHYLTMVAMMARVHTDFSYPSLGYSGVSNEGTYSFISQHSSNSEKMPPNDSLCHQGSSRSH